MKIAVTGTSEIALKVGSASITIKASGDIEIKGLNVKIEAMANLDAKAGAIATVAGAMVKVG
jgi:hypothetical protein